LRVFLSYHTPDRATALALKQAIEAALLGADVFVDQTHLRYGHQWQPALFDAIAKAQAFVILVSNRLGDWQTVEYYEAFDRKAKDRAFILLPVIIADRAKGPAANLPGLSQLHWIESTEPVAPEPLAKIVAALQSREIPKPPEPWRAINPYRGLLALEEQDADFFFGRDRETGDILDRLIAGSGRFIALVGNSGVGKSSLVQAGVIGALKRQRWPGAKQPWPDALKDSRAWAYLAMKPGEDPVAALASEFAALWFADATDPQWVARRNEWTKLLGEGRAGLADLIRTTDKRFDELALTPPPRLFLYIDQGEELYARAPTPERKRFSEIIAEGLRKQPQRLIVMTSQRADYFGELQANSALFNLTEVISVPPLDTDSLALVLREPARVLGVGFESDDLIRHVVGSAEDQPGALPLLADLFTDLWERMRERGDGTLRVSDRREIIQVGAALSKRADKFLTQNPDKVEAVKRLFTLRLAYVPRQGEPVRARWERDEKGEAGQAANAEWALVELLAGPDWRLLVTGEKDGKAVAEVAHEILLKTWPTLKRWLEDERGFLIWRGELDARQKEYKKAGKEGVYRQRRALLVGLPLDTAEKWLTARRSDIDPAARAFIEASTRADRAVARRWQWLQGAVGVLLVCIIGGLLARMYERELREEVFWATTFRGYGLKGDDVLALKPGQQFAECTQIWSDDQKTHQIRRYCPNMVVVRSGTFMMGDKAGACTGRSISPKICSQHEVTIAKPFAVSKFTVTFDQWDACVAGGGCGNYRPSDHFWGRGTRPVINVSWDDAQRYVNWLNKMSGATSYRLLSEAEFEYAARARTSTDYPWGDDIGKGNANCDGCGSQWGGKETAPVGSFKANEFGLYDMVGNVWQWVEDTYHNDYGGAPLDGSAWTEGEDRWHLRVTRGGSWFNGPGYLRFGLRAGMNTDIRSDVVGFRVGRTLIAGAGTITVAPGAH
jgi:formylglycine-generating enzyme required for sulfatase activity